jgi:hypothetical protein
MARCLYVQSVSKGCRQVSGRENLAIQKRRIATSGTRELIDPISRTKAVDRHYPADRYIARWERNTSRRTSSGSMFDRHTACPQSAMAADTILYKRLTFVEGTELLSIQKGHLSKSENRGKVDNMGSASVKLDWCTRRRESGVSARAR